MSAEHVAERLGERIAQRIGVRVAVVSPLTLTLTLTKRRGLPRRRPIRVRGGLFQNAANGERDERGAD
jgi:hypothetical protein